MGLLDDLTPPVKRYSCKVRTISEQLTDKDRATFLAAINDREVWSAIGLSNALKQRGVQIIDTSITRHRDGLCSC
jgi:hypothetical protein